MMLEMETIRKETVFSSLRALTRMKLLAQASAIDGLARTQSCWASPFCKMIHYLPSSCSLAGRWRTNGNGVGHMRHVAALPSSVHRQSRQANDVSSAFRQGKARMPRRE